MRISGSANEPYRLIQVRKTHPSYWTEAVGVMTKLPLLYHDSVSLGHGGRVALRANVEIPAERSRGRYQSLDFVTTHLHHERHDQDIRLDQAMQMVVLNERRRIPCR
ncbi:MAG: hypothetical protein R3C44_16495 [Chloroflexota bacterium]